jgi:hypothetical protein
MQMIPPTVVKRTWLTFSRKIFLHYKHCGVNSFHFPLRGPQVEIRPRLHQTLFRENVIQPLHQRKAQTSPMMQRVFNLVFAYMAYPFMVPYLKILHNSVEDWCLNRDKYGYVIEDQLLFREPDPEIEAIRIEKNFELQSLDTNNEVPATIILVPQVKRDMTSLKRLISLPSPIMLVLSPVLDHIWVAYGFGDAEREGTGRLIVRQSAHDHVRMRMEFWCSDHGEKTSNNREFRNLKDMVIDEAKLGSLTGHELFLGTDIQVAENVWHKGSSKELNMYEMMLELREAAIKFQFLLIFFHVVGTRMIEVGVDGLSRAEPDSQNLPTYGFQCTFHLFNAMIYSALGFPLGYQSLSTLRNLTIGLKKSNKAIVISSTPHLKSGFGIYPLLLHWML